MASPIRFTVTYGLDADAYLTARAVDSALSGRGCRVMVEEGEYGAEVYICRHNQPETEAVRFKPGQRLVVTYDDGWSIEPAPSAVTA